MRKVVDLPTREELSRMQQEDSHLKEVIKYLKEVEVNVDSQVTQDAKTAG